MDTKGTDTYSKAQKSVVKVGITSTFFYCYNYDKYERNGLMMEIKVILIVFGAVVAFLFWLIEYKISKMEKLSEQRYSEQINMRIAERELLMAEASISALTAKCIRGEHVNGDLEAAEKYLEEKKHAVKDLTNEYAIKAQYKRR